MDTGRAPKISILFPVFNGEKFLRQTLDTVVAQSFKDWELIAMDGASKDGTVAILNEYHGRYANIRVFSERDENGFHAITKAAGHARGDFIILLCASDGYLSEEWLQWCIDVVEKDTEVSLVWGIPFDMTEEGTLVGPHYVFAHFLEEQGSFSRFSIIKRIFRKLDIRHPSTITQFFKKINSANASSLGHMLRSEAPPQKKEWFSYWLKTGTVFPDGNMMVSRKAFFECFPKYEPGSRDPGDFGKFNFDFNSKGYLSYCIPRPANFGRTHGGQVGQAVKDYNDEVTKRYLGRIEELRERISRGENAIAFVDRAGKRIR